jgi:hypothetical protein
MKLQSLWISVNMLNLASNKIGDIGAHHLSRLKCLILLSICT